MKQSVRFLIFTAAMMVLTSCGAYVGAPPRTEVHETTTTEQPPAEVHVYNAP